MKKSSRQLPEYVPCDITAGGISPLSSEPRSAEHSR